MRKIAIKSDALGNMIAAREPFTTYGGLYALDYAPEETGRLSLAWARLYTTQRTINPGSIRYVILSFQTPIAWVLDTGHVWLPDTSYSATTTRHQNLVRTWLLPPRPGSEEHREGYISVSWDPDNPRRGSVNRPEFPEDEHPPILTYSTAPLVRLRDPDPSSPLSEPPDFRAQVFAQAAKIRRATGDTGRYTEVVWVDEYGQTDTFTVIVPEDRTAYIGYVESEEGALRVMDFCPATPEQDQALRIHPELPATSQESTTTGNKI